MKAKILVVEDRPENLATAKRLYSTKKDFHFDYAVDYDGAMGALEKEAYAGIVTDCFMPKKTGSRDISLGMDLVDRLERYAQNLKNPREFMLEVIKRSEANQPLGVLIVEYAQTHQIPYCMLTERHDEFGEKIVARWCRANKLSWSNPRDKEKSDPKFNYECSWGVALSCVENGVNKGYQKWIKDHIEWLEERKRS